HTRCYRDWSSDVCSSDLLELRQYGLGAVHAEGQLGDAVQDPQPAEPEAGLIHQVGLDHSGQAEDRVLGPRRVEDLAAGHSTGNQDRKSTRLNSSHGSISY